MSTDALAPCECSEHRCIPVPKQTMRYRVRVGAGADGLVALCASCFCSAHMKDYELTYQAINQAEEAAND